jgi:hypothetical protein
VSVDVLLVELGRCNCFRLPRSPSSVLSEDMDHVGVLLLGRSSLLREKCRWRVFTELLGDTLLSRVVFGNRLDRFDERVLVLLVLDTLLVSDAEV